MVMCLMLYIVRSSFVFLEVDNGYVLIVVLCFWNLIMVMCFNSWY